MATQVYRFKITYEGCEDKIWRIAEVSSNYTLAKLGYMVLATFDTMAYHMFEMHYKGVSYLLTEEEIEAIEDFDKEGIYLLLHMYNINKLKMRIGDVIKMIYDLGCEQVFNIELVEISEMQKGQGRAYPKIIDGAGHGIIDDMSVDELLDVINRTDTDGHSEVYYSPYGFEGVPEWDYRNFSIKYDNLLLKGMIERIQCGYEDIEE